MNITANITISEAVNPNPPLFRILHNPDVPMDGRPDVVVTAEYGFVPMTEPIQRLSYDLFYHFVKNAMPESEAKRKWRVLYGQDLAFTNTAGFDVPPPRRDYINQLDMSAELPNLQKGLICAGAVVTGREENGRLIISTLDPHNIPTLAWLLAHPWYYFEARIVYTGGTTGKFPQGNGEPVYVPLFSRVVCSLPAGRYERL